MPPTPASASIPASTIRHRFDFDWAVSSPLEDVDTYWWWARDVRVDPNEIWADDEQGNLWVVPFTTDGADDITFGTPVRSVEVAVPVEAGAGASATAAVDRRRQRVLSRATAAPTKPTHPEHPRASTGPQGQEEQSMPDVTTLRTDHGIRDDVSDEAILAVFGDPDEEQEEETAPAAASQVPAPPPAANSPQPQPVAASAELQLAAQQAVIDRLAASEAARAAREAAETRETVLSAAVREGRITPHERASQWEPFYDADPAKATAALAALPPNRHHVVEVGHAGGADTDPEAAAFASRRARLTGKETTNA
jgi:hypothetical protein